MSTRKAQIRLSETNEELYGYFPVASGETIGRGPYAQHVAVDGFAIKTSATPLLQPRLVPTREFDGLMRSAYVESNCRHPRSKFRDLLHAIVRRTVPSLRVGLTFRIACARGLDRLRDNIAAECDAYFGGASIVAMTGVWNDQAANTAEKYAGDSERLSGFALTLSLLPGDAAVAARLVRRIAKGHVAALDCDVNWIHVEKNIHLARHFSVATR